MLALEHAHLARGERTVLAGVSLSVAEGERVALLGRNGAGKTTLLEILAGAIPLEEGSLWRAEGLRIGRLDQHPQMPPGVRVSALVAAANPFLPLEADLRALERALEARPDDAALLERWSELHARLEAEGAYAWHAEAGIALGVLELSDFAERDAATLSGGERTRLALLLALLARPDLLLLDEPTNHLDIRMREWLEAQLLAARSAVVLTSHDRTLLDRVAVRSLWLEDGHAREYRGGYSKARAQRSIERRSLERASRLASREAERLEQAAEREGVWGRHADALRSRRRHLEVPEAPARERRARVRLSSGDARSRLLLQARSLHVAFGERTVLRDVALKIRQGDRIALIAPNGAGKTTLLRVLLGELYSDHPEAEVRYEAGVSSAYLDQTYHGLVSDRPLLAQFEERYGAARARALLGRAGFRPDQWARPPEALSGGERSRAGLALISALRADLLLLDEPTNHLDVEALEALEEALLAYEGAALIVTHDRSFARAVANRFWTLEGGQLIERESLNARQTVDPARNLRGDPQQVRVAPPTPRQRMQAAEVRLQEIDHLLTPYRAAPLPLREEARLRAEAHRLRARLGELYAEVYGAETFDLEVTQRPLRVRVLREDEAALLWARGAAECPHLRWDGRALHWSSAEGERWFRRTLLEGALQVLFERLDVRVVCLPGGETVTLEDYLTRLGYPH
nr:ABC-F family ATP-binding cassette domain-containing protein [Deinobacterium chartae]